MHKSVSQRGHGTCSAASACWLLFYDFYTKLWSSKFALKQQVPSISCPQTIKTINFKKINCAEHEYIGLNASEFLTNLDQIIELADVNTETW